MFHMFCFVSFSLSFYLSQSWAAGSAAQFSWKQPTHLKCRPYNQSAPQNYCLEKALGEFRMLDCESGYAAVIAWWQVVCCLHLSVFVPRQMPRLLFFCLLQSCSVLSSLSQKCRRVYQSHDAKMCIHVLPPCSPWMRKRHHAWRAARTPAWQTVPVLRKRFISCG